MTVVSVSRKKICDAIAKEPTTTLSAGRWVSLPTTRRSSIRSRDCTVCAVGAVMRRALLHPDNNWETISDAANAAVGEADALYEYPEAQARKGYYMASLSSFFENEYRKRKISLLEGRERTAAVKQLKTDCIKFVRKNFPVQLSIDIDGADPAKDVKVVQWG